MEYKNALKIHNDNKVITTARIQRLDMKLQKGQVGALRQKKVLIFGRTTKNLPAESWAIILNQG